MNNSTSAYFLETGYADHERLKILNQIYNPCTMEFFIKNGLNQGMTVLEYGVGAGFFAIELAKYIGKTGKVIAIDANEDSLNVARKNASDAQVNNIEFIKCKIEDISQLGMKFDFVYGRWVLVYNKELEATIQKIYEILNPNGILVCEEFNFSDTGAFSHPKSRLVEQYHKIGLELCMKSELNPSAAHSIIDSINNIFRNINLKNNQPILSNAYEKSIYRLGIINLKKSILEHKICSLEEINQFIEELYTLEHSNTFTGIIRNLLICAKKIENPPHIEGEIH